MGQVADPVGGAAESSAAPLLRRPEWQLTTYIWSVISLAAIALGVALFVSPIQDSLGSVSAWTGPYPSQGLVLTLLVITVIVGELRPVPVPRSGDVTDMITISTTFTLALAIVGPVSLALVAQGVAVLIDDAISRRSPLKIAFNVGQYVLTVMAARTAYALIAGVPILGPYEIFDPRITGPSLAPWSAALVFLLMNQLLVSTVVALASDQGIRSVFLQDLRFQAMTAGVLAVLAPVAALIVQAAATDVAHADRSGGRRSQQRSARGRYGTAGAS